MRGQNGRSAPVDPENWTRENLAWAGGLFEGEGCITVSGTIYVGRRQRVYHLQVTSTDKDVLDRFVGIIGGGSYYQGKMTPSNIKPYWVWRIRGRLNVYAVGIALWPWLGERRRAKFGQFLEAAF